MCCFFASVTTIVPSDEELNDVTTEPSNSQEKHSSEEKSSEAVTATLYVCAFAGLLTIILAIYCFSRRRRYRQNVRETREACVENTLTDLYKKRSRTRRTFNQQENEDSSDLSDCEPIAASTSRVITCH